TNNGVSISGCTAVALNVAKQAMCSTSALTVGAHSIVATYAGDASYAGSISSTLSQTVNTAVVVQKQRDYDGDSRGDLLWKSSLLQTALWLMNGVSATAAVVNLDPSWTV